MARRDSQVVQGTDNLMNHFPVECVYLEGWVLVVVVLHSHDDVGNVPHCDVHGWDGMRLCHGTLPN